MAKYDLSKPMRRAQFERRSDSLKERGRFVELKELTARSLKQNNYLHLILSYYGLEFGYSLSYVKRNIFKMIVNPQIFFVDRVNEKSGEVYRDIRSSADLSKEETCVAIDRFKDHSAQGGLVLPDPDNIIYLKEIMEEIESAKRYL